jgi:hypothetical protein
MNNVLPETDKAGTPKRGKLLALGAVGIVLSVGFIYAVSKALPNLGGNTDLSAFKVGPLAALEVLPKPPPQPTNMFQGPDGAPVSLAAKWCWLIYGRHGAPRASWKCQN